MFTKCNRSAHFRFGQNNHNASFEEKLKRMRKAFESQHQSFFNDFRSFGHYPVNIKETENTFEMYLFAPGLEKENFKISIQHDILTVAYDLKPQEENEQWVVQEMTVTAFERSFQLNAKVLADSIKAHYANGVLHIILPKDPERNIPSQKIPVG